MENVEVLHFLKLHFSDLTIIFFYPEHQKTIFSDFISPKKKKIKKISIFGQKKTLYYTLRKMTIFLTFKTFVFNLKFILFLYRIPRNDLFEHNYFENTTEKKIDCWAKTMDQPSRKRSIFWRSTERYLSGLKIILF